jgi:hypothetical protein
LPCLPPLFARAAADCTVSRRQALALLRGWYLSAPHDPPPVSSPRTASPANCASSDGRIDGVELATPAGSDAAAAAERAWQDDAAFMAWAQGSGGGARVALELRQLRMRAAARAVEELAGTAEGTEGLVAGLRQALQANPSLLLQLRSLVAPRP